MTDPCQTCEDRGFVWVDGTPPDGSPADCPDCAAPQPDTAPDGPTSDLAEVLHQALRHFVHLDESNAAIHCAPVRYSPITFRLAEQTEALTVAPGDEFAARVLDHVGQYEEDTGR